ncbi:hypothetical protein PBAL39_19000 [Pedobacter sp. BAL39]|uniref:DUF1398 domain-containing protein n=1 Tax=Pedobacter sp. BAL39 TaxID=391596 RepID=UPI000155AA12|nr:DUF1398 family protein [Pedobacter sp. BAL39]EDM34409.1 hypothetical protein PBAL39_19000 [Pedobacter sp. BAL39]
MFTIAEIKAAHSNVKSGADFPAYITTIHGMGVIRYDVYVSDGHTDYYGERDFKISSDGKYDQLTISDVSNPGQFKVDLKAHQQGKTDYLTFCKDAAKSGVYKWQVVMKTLTCIYFDGAGQALLAEIIPQ